MSKDLNDALHRLARLEELDRRRNGGDSALDDAVLAVRRVVERHPELSLTLTVRAGDQTAVVEVEKFNGKVQVNVTRGTTVPTGNSVGAEPVAEPLAEPVAEPLGEPPPAVRLAEMLRHDPYLFDD